MTINNYDNSATSEGAWDGLMFAAINAGLDQGVFGRRTADIGSMEPSGLHSWRGHYSFDHCGLTFNVRVDAQCGGAELSIWVWLPNKGGSRSPEPWMFTRLADGFDVIAHGWVERENGFYLLTYGRPTRDSFSVRSNLSSMLRSVAVTVPDFYVRPARAWKASA